MDEQEQAPAINLDPRQVQQAAASVVDFFNLDTTLIPGSRRGQVSVIAAVLVGIAQGQLMVGPAVEKEVESKTGAGTFRPAEVQRAIDAAKANDARVAEIAELDGIDDDAATEPEA